MLVLCIFSTLTLLIISTYPILSYSSFSERKRYCVHRSPPKFVVRRAMQKGAEDRKKLRWVRRETSSLPKRTQRFVKKPTHHFSAAHDLLIRWGIVVCSAKDASRGIRRKQSEALDALPYIYYQISFLFKRMAVVFNALDFPGSKSGAGCVHQGGDRTLPSKVLAAFTVVSLLNLR